MFLVADYLLSGSLIFSSSYTTPRLVAQCPSQRSVLLALLGLSKVRIGTMLGSSHDFHQPSSSHSRLQDFLPKESECRQGVAVALPNKWLKNPLQPTLVEELRQKAK